MDRRHFHNGKLVSSEAFEALQAKEDATTPCKASRSPLEETPAKVEVAPTKSLQDFVTSKRFLVLSLPNCPQCDQLGEALAKRGVPSSVFEKWSKESEDYPKLKKSLAEYAGDGFTFPQVFSDGQYQGGFEQAMTKLEDGVYDEVFREVFDIVPTTVKRMVERQPMVAFSLTHCPQCDVLRDQLEKKGLPVKDIFIKWDKATPQYQSLKKQLIELIGVSQFTFPQTFVRADYQGGFDEVMGKLEAGHLNAFFSEAFGIAEPEKAPPSFPEAVAFDDDF